MSAVPPVAILQKSVGVAKVGSPRVLTLRMRIICDVIHDAGCATEIQAQGWFSATLVEST